MMKTVQLQSEVGKDGVLALRVPLGSDEAGHRVIITIEPLSNPPENAADRMGWHKFIDETYGSCSELGLERPDQGEFESRESIE
jgi:hypothetical protein